MEREVTRDQEGKQAPADCCPLISNTFRCVLTVTCCFLLNCTLGTYYAFANINPYLTSYLRNGTSDHDIDYTDTLWIYQTTNIVAYVLMPIVGFLANRLHTKLFLALGFLCHTGSLIGTYWTVQQSFSLVVLTYGLLFSVTMATCDPTHIRVAVGWVPQKKGLICGLVLMGYGVGAVVWNELTTWYINPHNLQPDLRVGQDVYYTQAEVLDKVPSCFLLLGGICGSVQLLCTLLLCPPPPRLSSQDVDTESTEEEKKKLLDPDDPINSSLVVNSDNSEEHERGAGSTGYGTVTERRTGGPTVAEEQAVQYHPLQVLRSRVFWTLWLMMASSILGLSFVITLFKAYGQTFIPDDHFLALVASLSAVFNAVGRPFWGLLADKIGFRMVALIAQAVLAALVGSFVTCEVTGRAAFMVWVCGMFLSACGYFTMLYALIYALFGARYYNVNLGLHGTNGVVGVLLATLIAPILKDTLGWHGLFYVGFGGCFVGVLLNMSLDIRWGDSIPQHMWPALSLR